MKHNFKESVAPRCPPGYTLRKSYTTKDGTFVPARCIVERGIFPRNMKKFDEEQQVKEQNTVKKYCRNRSCPTECPKGEILREGYVREAYTKKDGTRVNSTIVEPECIKNLGKPGKGPKLIDINPADHILSDHGYNNVKDLSVKERKDALMKVIRAVTKDYGRRQALIYVIKALTARSTLLRTGSPESSKVFKEDQEWVSGLLDDYKAKDTDKKDKKQMRLILLSPTDHILSEHGYKNVSGLGVEKRHKILKKVVKDISKQIGEREAYGKLVKELTARATLGMTKSPEASKIFKMDANWMSELLKEWKDKHKDDKGDKKGRRLKLKEVKLNVELVDKKKGQKLKLIQPKLENKVARKLDKMSKSK